MEMKATTAGLIGGLVGAVGVWVFQTGSFSLVPVGMSYADLAATLLSAVSILVTVLGVFIAILAIWGYKKLKDTARDAAKLHVATWLEGGGLKLDIEKLVGNFMEEQLKAGNLRKLLESRVDHILFAGAALRAKEEEKQEFEDDEA